MQKNTCSMIAVALVSTIYLSGCSSTDEKQVREAPIECNYPDAPAVQAPNWVCDEKSTNIVVTAVGSSPFSKAGYGFTEQQAAVAARVKLAQQMKVRVQNMVSQFAESTGVGDTETVDKVNSSVTKQITDAQLVGSKIIKKITSPNKTLYVLIGLDSTSVQGIAKQAIQSSLNNENALWQQFKAKSAHEDLAEGIAKAYDPAK